MTDLFSFPSFGLKSGRAYIFTSHDFDTKVTTNVCLNFTPEAKTRWIEKVEVQLEQRLVLYSLVVSYALHYWNKDGSIAREQLLQDVCYMILFDSVRLT
jgi:hypothetical protein